MKCGNMEILFFAVYTILGSNVSKGNDSKYKTNIISIVVIYFKTHPKFHTPEVATYKS